MEFCRGQSDGKSRDMAKLGVSCILVCLHSRKRVRKVSRVSHVIRSSLCLRPLAVVR
jgi:hypothetical protein